MNGFDDLIAEFHRWSCNWRWWMQQVAQKLVREGKRRSSRRILKDYLLAADELMPSRLYGLLKNLMGRS
jgi:hypothetical protein